LPCRRSLAQEQTQSTSKRFAGESGATAIEYGLIAAGICCDHHGGELFGSQLKTQLFEGGTQLATAGR
jgi:hypothetical protein